MAWIDGQKTKDRDCGSGGKGWGFFLWHGGFEPGQEGGQIGRRPTVFGAGLEIAHKEIEGRHGVELAGEDEREHHGAHFARRDEIFELPEAVAHGGRLAHGGARGERGMGQSKC